MVVQNSTLDEDIFIKHDVQRYSDSIVLLCANLILMCMVYVNLQNDHVMFMKMSAHFLKNVITRCLQHDDPHKKRKKRSFFLSLIIFV